MEFGERLKQLRKAHNATQDWLAREVGMDAAYLSRIENGVTPYKPSQDTLWRLAKALKLSTADSDELHALALKIPADVELILLDQPELFAKIRRMAK